MMNNTAILGTPKTHHELAFGSWKVSLDRSPKRTAASLDFGVGARWALFGAVTGMLLIAAANVWALGL
ncbi:MAG: hypothetical protein IPJ41_06260 [Phycisphaerales bacterium]|nr:hypothetical protein [Phycisphaerales bacterium]